MTGRVVGILALVCLLGSFGFVWSSVDKCSRSEKCAGYTSAPKRSPPQKSEETFWDRTTNDPIALYTFSLAIFTAGLTIASVWQAYYLVRAERITKTTADAALAASIAATAQTEHMQSWATEAVRTAKAAETQTKLIGLQASLLEQQTEIARQAYLGAHRPRLTIRNVVLTQDESHWRGQQGITIGEIPRGQLYVVNTGGSEALITDAMVIIHTQEKSVLPMERPYEGQHGNVGAFSVPLLAGQSVPIPFASDRPIGDDQATRILEGADGFLYVMGWVEYRSALYDIGSDSHVIRRTAFCRVFNAETGRFVRVNDEDYEHEE